MDRSRPEASRLVYLSHETVPLSLDADADSQLWFPSRGSWIIIFCNIALFAMKTHIMPKNFSCKPIVEHRDPHAVAKKVSPNPQHCWQAMFSLSRGWYRDRIMIFCQKIWYFRSRLVQLAFEFSNAPLMSYCDRYFLPVGEIIFVRDFS
jgi:hypothetical protein